MIKADFYPNDPDVIKDMYKLLGFNKITKLKYTYIILTIITFAISAYYYFFNLSNHQPWYLGFGFLAFAFRQIDIEKLMLKQWRDEAPYTRTILEFHEDKYIISFIGNGCCCLTECNYNRFKKAIETEEYFCWHHDNTSYIIRKNSFVEGTPEELSALFKEKLGSRFVIKN